MTNRLVNLNELTYYVEKKFIFLILTLVPLLGIAQNVLVIRNVSIVDMKDSKIKKNKTVIIEGNKIVAITTNGKIPASSKIVDGSGKFLIPGLWDMHVHTLRRERVPLYLPQLVANGIIGIRDMSTPLEDFDLFRQARVDNKRDSIVRPHFIVACGPALDGPNNARPGLSIPISSVEQAKEAVDLLYNHGANFIKVYSMLRRDAFFAIIDQARKRGLSVAGHIPAFVSALEASDAGLKSMEHSYGILECCSRNEATIRKEIEQAASNANGPAAWAAVVRTTDKAYADYAVNSDFDQKKADTLFSHFMKNGTWQCPTLVVRLAFALMNDSNFTNDKRVQYIPKTDVDRWNPQADLRHKDLTQEETRRRNIRLQEESKNVGRMKKAGVGILAGTDLGNPFIFPGFSLHDELELLVKAGLTPFEALKTATINPARFLNMQDSMGTIEKGSIADLVLLNANPVENISNTKKIEAVIVNGRLLQREELDAILTRSKTLAGNNIN